VNDDQLIDQTLSGDTDAFGLLVRKYQDRLCHSLRQVLGSAHDVEDVVQQAFVQAFVKLETFQRAASFYTWVYRIAMNSALTLRRRSAVRAVRLVDADGQVRDVADPGPAPDGRLDQQERAAQVQAALATLAEEQRVVLVLREIDGLDYEAIGDVLAIPVGTVRSRLFRARAQFAERMKQVLQNDPTGSHPGSA
jgi:RNA polymerase sigma-70 factor (ECF subfamily)